MNKFQSFEQFLTTQSIQISIYGFIINFVLSAILAVLLAKLYIKCGTTLSNRKKFSENFLLLALTTMLIISIVKSSLALSLGLVGALSIVRFRAAIKEPEELAYLFLTIAIGLGFGADQKATTLIAFGIISALILIKHKLRNRDNTEDSIFLTVRASSNQLPVEKIVEILKETCKSVSLKRLDEKSDELEASFYIHFGSFDKLNEAKKRLQESDLNANILFMDNKGLI